MKANTSRKRLVIANWKMNPSNLSEARDLFISTKKEASRRMRVETVVAAPFIYLAEFCKFPASPRTLLGAQDVFWEKDGAYTGEISVSMLASVGVTHVIIGHSERRALGETDEMIRRKVSAAVKGTLAPVLCIGESARDHSGHHLTIVEDQLRDACADVPKTALESLSIAYEPIWAISSGDGRGQAASADDIHEMTIFIRKVLTSLYTRKDAEGVRVLYGGSVNEDNASMLIKEGRVDGFLVGGASIKINAFASILTAANAS